MSTIDIRRYAFWILLALHWPLAAQAAFTCSSVPTTLNGGATPVAAGSGDLSIGNNSTLSTSTTACATPNGTTCTNAAGSDTTLTQGTGVGPPTQTLPPFQPTTFPSVGTTDVTNAHNTTRAEGAYRKVTTAGTVTFTGGTYYIDELIADKSGSNNPTLKMAAGDYFINKFSATNNFTLQVTSGPVRIFINTSWAVGNDASVNAGGAASNFQMFVYNSGSVQFGNNANSNTSVDFSGLIYAPGASTSIQMGNNVVQGAILSGGGVQLGNNVGVIFDATTQAAISSINTCGLVADYRFDACSWTSGTANAVSDSSGNARHGTPYVATLSAGKINNSANMTANGTTDYLTFPYQVVHGKTDFTATLWFKTAVSKAQQEVIQALGTSGVGDDAFEIYLVNSTQVVVNFKDSADLVFTAPSTLTNNAWHHLAVTRSGTSGCLYIDGTLVQCKTYSSGTLSINSSAFLSGQEQDAYGGSFNAGQNFEGALDELKFFLGALTASDISTIYTRENSGLNFDGTARTNPCAVATLHHVRLDHTGSGVTCTGSAVTVRACDGADSGGACTANTAGLSGNVTTSSGVSVAFTIPAGSSSATVSVPVTTAQTVTLGTSSLSVTPSSSTTCWNGAAASCSHVYSDAGFIFSSSLNGASATIPAQTAGTSSSTYYLRAVRTNTTTKACEAALAGSNAVNFGYECNNPTTCSSSNLMSINGGTATTIARNNNGSVSSSTAVPMTFDADGNAPFTLNFSDVGMVTLYASKAAGGSLLTALTGSSNAFVTKPAGFAVSGIKQTAAPQLVNPAPSSGSGSKFVKAGESFTATVTAVTSGGVATPNYGKETSPEGVTLTQALVFPAGGNSGSLSNGVIAGGSFSNGAATVTSLTWSEVGVIVLTPSIADSDYLGAGNVTGPATGNVGRFYPDHFAVKTGSTLTPGCSAGNFTYMGQGFTAGFTLQAQNASNGVTTNYGRTGYGPVSTGTLSVGAENAANGTNLNASGTRITGLSPTAIPANGWTTGEYTYAPTTLIFTRLSSADGPYDSLNIGVKLTDGTADNVPMSGTLLSNGYGQIGATTRQRYGLLKIDNMYGSEMLDLTLPLTVRYWDGSKYVDNTLDSCSAAVLTSAAFTLGGYAKNLNSTNLGASHIGNSSTFAAGKSTVRITKPSPSATGSANLTSGLSYLPGSGKVTFGVYKTPQIYLKENF